MSDLFKDESCWIRGNMAKTRSGRIVAPASEDATCWCIAGAMSAVPVSPARRRILFKKLTEAVRRRGCKGIADFYEGITDFNDAPNTQFKDVCEVVREAEEGFDYGYDESSGAIPGDDPRRQGIMVDSTLDGLRVFFLDGFQCLVPWRELPDGAGAGWHLDDVIDPFWGTQLVRKVDGGSFVECSLGDIRYKKDPAFAKEIDDNIAATMSWLCNDGPFTRGDNSAQDSVGEVEGRGDGAGSAGGERADPAAGP